jgi:hypothetical protein
MRAPNSNLLQPGGGFLLHRHAGLAPTIMQPHSQLNGAAFPAEETAAKYLFGAEGAAPGPKLEAVSATRARHGCLMQTLPDRSEVAGCARPKSEMPRKQDPRSVPRTRSLSTLEKTWP